MINTALFVVHAGEGIGLGHLTRSLVAARALTLKLGLIVDFVAVGENIDRRFVDETRVKFLSVSDDIDTVISRISATSNYSLICLDLFNSLLTGSLRLALQRLKKKGAAIVGIDSLPGFEDLLDLLYVPSFLPPANIAPGAVDLAYGWDAYLLNVPNERTRSIEPKSALILTGGSDVTNLGSDLPLKLASNLAYGSVVRYVTGPYSPSPKFPSSSNVRFIEHIAPTGLSELMNRAEVALTVFGVSFFELAAVGVPTVVFSPYGDKDIRELKEIEKQGIAVVANNVNDAVEKTSLLQNDSALRGKLSKGVKNRFQSFHGDYFVQEVEKLMNINRCSS